MILYKHKDPYQIDKRTISENEYKTLSSKDKLNYTPIEITERKRNYV